MTNEPFGLYVHIPFCQARCTYCDFNTVTGMTAADHRRYVACLLRELGQERPPGSVLVSLYFGGGTPSLIDPELLHRVIESVRGWAPQIDDHWEVTVEVNPGTVTLERFRALREAGVNRLSIGAQARQDHHLRALNRIHTVAEIDRTVDLARAAGFQNVNLDAIYGLPQQTLEEWQETVDGLLALAPDHLSLYALTVEAGTPLHRAVRRGTAVLPPSDAVADMADWAEERLTTAGLYPYEISNYARPGKESRHNRLYWELKPYLALGAGAHAYVPGRRWWNLRGVRRYMETVEGGADPREGEELLSPEEEMRQFLWLGLREREGVSCLAFQRRFGLDVYRAFGDVLQDLAARGLLTTTPERLFLTRRGRDLANWVAEMLVDAPVSRR
ncbi:MAG: radical SAM family heme chaperone HemW [Firmicutes bacterium]|nr:radical SAM family heme chaperone HemW [Bacillota bacterium]